MSLALKKQDSGVSLSMDQASRVTSSSSGSSRRSSQEILDPSHGSRPLSKGIHGEYGTLIGESNHADDNYKCTHGENLKIKDGTVSKDDDYESNALLDGHENEEGICKTDESSAIKNVCCILCRRKEERLAGMNFDKDFSDRGRPEGSEGSQENESTLKDSSENCLKCNIPASVIQYCQAASVDESDSCRHTVPNVKISDNIQYDLPFDDKYNCRREGTGKNSLPCTSEVSNLSIGIPSSGSYRNDNGSNKSTFINESDHVERRQGNATDRKCRPKSAAYEPQFILFGRQTGREYSANNCPDTNRDLLNEKYRGVGGSTRLNSADDEISLAEDEGVSFQRINQYRSFRSRDPAPVFRSRDSLGSFRMKNPQADLEPISDPYLRKKLQGTSGSKIKLSSKDQKMLSRLLAVKERDEEMLRQRDLVHRQWEEERLRRQQMTRGNKSQLNRPVEREIEQSKLQHKFSASDTLSTCSSNDSNSSPWQQRADHAGRRLSVCSQLKEDKNDAERQLNKALDKRHAVERGLKEQKEKTELYMARIQEHDEKVNRQNQKSQSSNRSLSSGSRYRSRSNQSLNNMKEDVSSGSDSVAAQMRARNIRIEKSRAELQKKLERSRDKQKEMETELQNWQEQVLLYREMQDKHAAALAAVQLARKKESKKRDREEREQKQRQNRLRMQALEDERQATVKASIISKDARSKILLKEKEEAVRRSREMADITRRMRDELKLNASINDLSNLNNHVVLENKMKLQSPP